MGNSFKKFISILCVLSLLIGLVPSAAFAAPDGAEAERAAESVSGAAESGEPAADRGVSFSPKTGASTWEGLQAQINNAASGATIELDSDITAGSQDNYPLTIQNKSLTIDLKGHKIDRNLSEPVNNGCVIYVYAPLDGVVTIKDSSQEGGGTITGGKNNYRGGGIYVQDGGLVLSNVSVTGNTSAIDGGGISMISGDTLTVSGCSIANNTAAENGGGIYMDGSGLTMSESSVTGNRAANGGGIYSDGNTAFSFSGVSISGNTAEEDWSKGVCINSNGDTLELVGASGASAFNFADSIYLPEGKTITLSGAPVSNSSIHVRVGGAPTVDTPVVIATPKNTGVDCSAWLDCFKNDAPTQDTELVCENNQIILRDISITTWADLQGRLTNAQEGDTITLTQNITAGETDSALVFNKNVSVTLDLNGCTIDRGLYNKSRIHGGNVLTVNGGSLTLRDSSAAKTGKITGGYSQDPGGGIIVESGGIFTMESGSITGNSTTRNGGGLSVDGGSAIMNGGVISDNNSNGSSSLGGGVCVSSNGSFTMSGGSITGNSTTGNGGGIYVNSSATINIQDDHNGEYGIYNNTATNGGGIYVFSGGKLDLKGGRIEDNESQTDTGKGDGIFLKGSLTLNAGSVLTVTDSVYLPASKTINVQSTPAEGSSVHVQLEATATRDNPVTIATSNSDCKDIFTIENQQKNTELIYESNAIKLKLKPGVTTWAELQTALNNGGTSVEAEPEDYYIVRLDSDVTAGSGDSALAFNYTGHDVTLDLNGHTIDRDLTAPAAGGNVLTMTDGKLIICDNSTAKTGSITGGYNTAAGGGVVVNGGSLFVDDASITENKSESKGGGVYVGGGSFTLQSGSITGNTAGNTGGGVAVGGGSATILGGSITGNTASYETSMGIDLDSGSLTLTGSSVPIVTDSVYLPYEKTITLTGSPAHGSSVPVTIQHAPTFGRPVTIAVSEQDKPDWKDFFTVVGAAENTQLAWAENQLILQVKPEVSSWQGLQSALTMGGARDYTEPEVVYIIRLANDITAGDSDRALTFNYTGHDVILDLNGYKIDRNLGKIEFPSPYDNVLDVNGGTLILRDSSAAKSGRITGGFASSLGGGVNIMDGATLTMEGGSITGNKAPNYGGVYVYYGGGSGGTLNLKGGSISGNTALTSNKGNGGRVDVGATLILPAGSAFTVTDDLYLPDGSVIQVKGAPAAGSEMRVSLERVPTLGNPVIIADSEVNCASNFHVENQPTSTELVYDNGQVKLITEGVKTWADLQAALDEGGTQVEDDYIIQLGADVVAGTGDERLNFNYEKISPIVHPVILDLNGYKIDRHLDAPTENGNVLTVHLGTLILRDSRTGGQITGGYNNDLGSGVIVLGDSTFTMESGSITGNKTQGFNGAGVYLRAGTFNLHGGSITGNTAENAKGGGVYAAYGSADHFYVSGSPVVTDNGDSNVYLEVYDYIHLDAALTEGASIGIGAEYEGTFAPDVEYDQVSGFFTADSGYYLYKDSSGHPAIEPESHHPASEPVWTWAENLSSATASMHCKNCGYVIWSESTSVSFAYDEQDGKFYAAAAVTHESAEYSDRKEVTPESVAEVPPAIDENGTYSTGMHAYYTLTAGDKTYYFTSVNDHPGERCELSDLVWDTFIITATSQNNGVIVQYVGPFAETGTTTIDLPKRIRNTVDQSTEFVPLKMLGDGTHAFYTQSGTSSVEITDGGTITNLSAGSFAGLGNLTLTLNAEESITIAQGAFTGCQNVTVKANHASGLLEGAHDDATGKYAVELLDAHSYTASAAWAEDYSAATITLACACGDTVNNIPATVTRTDTPVEDPETHETTGYAISITASGTYKEQTHTVTLDNVPYFNATVEGTGTLRMPKVRKQDESGYDERAVFTVTQTMLDPLTPPPGAVLAGLTDGSHTYVVGDTVTITQDADFTADWDSTWARVQAALNAGGEVTLYSNITPAAEGDSYLHVPADKAVTLNLGGYTVNRNLSNAVNDGYVIRVDGTLTLSGGTVTGGNNTGDGGGVYLYNDGVLQTNNVNITGNRAGGNGGGVYMVDASEATFNNSEITQNHAAQNGGGLYIGGVLPQPNGGLLRLPKIAKLIAVLAATSISGNSSAMNGGGIHVNTGEVQINSGSSISNNVASNGGGVNVDGGEVQTNNASITRNSAEHGGGVRVNGGEVRIGSNTEIVNNTDRAGANFNNIDVQDGGKISIAEGASDLLLGLPALTAAGISGLPRWAEGLIAAGVVALACFIFDRVKEGGDDDQKKECEHPEGSKRGELSWDEDDYAYADEYIWCSKCGKGLDKPRHTPSIDVDETTKVTTYTVHPRYATEDKERKVNPYKLIEKANLPQSLIPPAKGFEDKETLIPHEKGEKKTQELSSGRWVFEDAGMLHAGWFINPGTTIASVEFDEDHTEITVKAKWQLSFKYEPNAEDTQGKPPQEPNPRLVDTNSEEDVLDNQWTRTNYIYKGWEVAKIATIKEAQGGSYKIEYSGYQDLTSQKIKVSVPTLIRAKWQSKWKDLAETLEKDPYSFNMSENVSAVNGDEKIGIVAGHIDTLDLNGKRLDASSQYGVKHIFDISGTLTVKSTDHDAAGVVTGAKTDQNGAGAYVQANGKLTLQSGSIKENETEASGGGVYIANYGTFAMSGGEISGNQAGVQGGGVYVGGTFEVSGKVIIKDNTLNGKANNVYLPEGKTITVADALTDDARIHVSMEKPGVITSGLNANGGSQASGSAANFVSDDENYMVVIEDGEAKLVEAKPYFSDAALELGGVLNLRFYVTYPENWDTANDRVEFTVNGVSHTVSYDESEEDDTGRYFPCPVAAFQMADLITAVYYHGTDEMDSVEDYSVKKNLDYLDGKTTGDTQALVRAAMDFGWYIQPFLAARNNWEIDKDHAAMTPFNADLQPMTEVPGEYAHEVSINSKYVKNAMFALSTYQDNALKVTVVLKDGVTGDITGTVNGKDVTPTSAGTNAYELTLGNLPSNALATAYNFTLSVGGTKVFDFTASALSYARLVLPQSDTDAQKLALTALYNYALAAQKYKPE